MSSTQRIRVSNNEGHGNRCDEDRRQDLGAVLSVTSMKEQHRVEIYQGDDSTIKASAVTDS